MQKDNPGLWEGNEPVKKFDDNGRFMNGHMIHLLPNVLGEFLYEAEVFSFEDEEDSEQNEIVWPTPRSLVNENQPVMAMTKQMLPRAMRSYLINANPGAPLDYITVTAIIVAGSLIGSGCGMCPSGLDDNWVELPNLWGALIGEPGIKKTPSMDQVLSLVGRLQAEYTNQHKSKEPAHEFHTIRHKAKLDAIKKQIQKLATAIPDETTTGRNLVLKRKFEKLSKTKPVNFRRLFMTNETSVQCMTKLQAENPRGILLNRDELAGLLAEWYGKNASDRGYYLSGWNRMGSYTDTKISRGITEADNICISLLGTIQPDKFKIYVQKAAQGSNDGLIQRFQLAVYPDAPKEWKHVDRKQDEKEIERVYSIFEMLAEMDFLECGAATTSTLAKYPYFHFDEKAQQIFNDWNEDLNTNKIKNEPNVLISEHLSKYPKLFASLALIFHCIELADDDDLFGDVNAYAAELAVKWCEYLETHARRIYALSDHLDENKAVIRLSEMIKAKEVPSPFNAKDIYGRHMTALKTREEVEAACEVLVEANWLKKQESEKGKGRPPLDKYIINPTFM